MSTIKVNKIENTSTTDGGVEIDSNGHVQVDGVQMPTAGALSNRNMIINGAMQVAQRATSATGVTSSAYHAVDRIESIIGSMGTYTVSQSTDAPSGFTKSFKYEVTTAETSPTANAQCAIQYTFEGQDVQLLDYGASSAKSMTLSFWVKSSTTGTYSNEFFQDDNSLRNYIFSYTINAADTWEYKTVTISGDTAGVINDDNSAGLTLKMYQAAGSSFTSGTFSPGSWASRTKANVVSSSSPNLASTVGNTWQITGVQLEVGEKATPFEHRSYGDELARCQRYYYLHAEGTSSDIGVGTYYSNSLFAFTVKFPVTMRIPPDLDYVTGSNYYRIFRAGTADVLDAMSSAARATENTMGIDTSTGTSGTVGHCGLISANNASAYVAFDAEL